MPDTAVCSKCKGEVDATAERCPHCGSWFGTPPSVKIIQRGAAATRR